MKNAEYTPSHIANFFLEKGIDDRVPLTQLKLIKLLYFGYGWVLATVGDKLFDEPIEAWQYGPVVPSIYHEFKHYQRRPITDMSISVDLNTFDTKTPKVNKSDDAVGVLAKVWDVYNPLSATALVRLSHEEGSPWHKHYRPGVFNIQIPDEDIKDHFREKIQEYLNDD